LFDSGADPEGRALDALLAAMHARRDDVSDVFLTHGHGDHVAAAPLATRARIHAGKDDVAMMAQKSPMVPLLARYMRFVLPTPVVTASDAIAARREIPVDGADKVIAIPFPGHTPGSTIYFYAGVLFAGDAVNFENDKLTLAFAPFTVDTQLNRRNVAALGTFIPLDQIKVVCTGHSGCTPEADTRRMLDDVIKKASS
ncbi:MAG TPA: MBL fold metallo-hydrolase, partial [Polyangia bacterium]|nr:MBL fold metallo-hydrolase [Polyangia bacterium]